MPTPTELTPAEIAALECRIAEGVMGWIWKTGHAGSVVDAEGYWMDENGQWSGSRYWSPWRDPAAALKVLERLVVLATAEQEGPEPPSWTISRYKWGGRWENSVTLGVDKAHAPGDHYGPAVCRLAENILSTQSAERAGGSRPA